MTIQRYDLYCDNHGELGVERCDDYGEWVKYKDHLADKQAALDEIDQLRAQILAAAEAWEKAKANIINATKLKQG